MSFKLNKKGRRNSSSLAKIVLFSTSLALFGLQGIYASEPPKHSTKYPGWQNIQHINYNPESALESAAQQVSYVEDRYENEEFFKDYVDVIRKIIPKMVCTPILYIKKPTRTEKQKLILQENEIDTEIIDEGSADKAISYAKCVLDEYENDKEVLRSAFLPSGYFFTENVHLAYWLYCNTRFDTFFEDNEINLIRGDQSFTLVKREEGLYYYKNKKSSASAYFLFNDKVGSSLEEVLSGYNHIDLKRLQEELKFNTLKVISPETYGVKVMLCYSNNVSVEGILMFKEGKAKFSPVSMGREEYEKLLEERREFFDFVNRLRSQVRQFQEDGLFFDEPEGELEEEQLDGLLRALWTEAYYKGEIEYSFRDHTHKVFAKNGNVKVPQVCTDFIIDVFESASGFWFVPYGQPPGRTEGFLNFKKSLEISDSYDLRRISKLIQNAKEHKDKFEYFKTPRKNEVAYEEEGFYENLFYLIDHGMDLQPLDIIIIYGPLKDEKMHYHSTVVSKVDPLTGFPTELMENPSYVKFNKLGKILSRAEKRWIHARIRIKPEWILEQKKKRH